MSFKELDQSTDVQTQLSVVNEIIPITGSFLSGTDFYTQKYINITSGSAVSGGFFETLFDGAPTSISSSALMDLTYGHSTASLNATEYSETFLNDEKQRVYKQMAQILLGDEDALFSFNDVTYHEMFFLLFKRRIFKDEIKKGNTSINVQMSGVVSTEQLIFTDAGASSIFTVGPAGDEAALYSGSTEVGQVYYNAGIVAIPSGALLLAGIPTGSTHWSGSLALDGAAISGTIDNITDGFRNHLNNIQFQNQTNLHSTIYFCRALNADFNYSTNKTFLDSDNRVVPTSGTDNQTRTYVTTIGLYDINDNLLAVAKTSEPVKKSPDNEVIFRVKLSY